MTTPSYPSAIKAWVDKQDNIDDVRSSDPNGAYAEIIAIETELMQIGYKPSARVATTQNGDLATAFANGQTVDGIVLSTGDRILLKDQANGAENGIYTVNASGAPSRAVDVNTATHMVPGLKVYVCEGAANAKGTWKLTTIGTITLGTTLLTFENELVSHEANKVQHRFNVLDYGAKCDAKYYDSTTKDWYTDAGFTQLANDDTTAINNAITASVALGGGIVFIPRKSRTTSPILGYDNVILEGNGKQISGIFNANHAGQPAFVKNGSTRIQAIGIRDMGVFGNPDSGIGIDLDKVGYSHLFNVLSYGHGSHGIRIYGDGAVGGSYYNKFYDVDSTDNAGDGIHIEDYANDTFIFGGRFSANIGNGLNIVKTAYAVNSVHVFGISAEGNTGYAINNGGAGTTVMGSRFENNNGGAIGIKILSTGLRAFLCGNYYASQSTYIGSDIADGGASSPTILEPQLGHKLNLVDTIQMTGNAAISGVKGLSTTTTPAKNFLLKDLTVTQGVTQMTFTLPTAEPDVNYRILGVIPNWVTSIAMGSKSTTTFSLYFGTAAPASSTVSCMLVRC